MERTAQSTPGMLDEKPATASARSLREQLHMNIHRAEAGCRTAASHTPPAGRLAHAPMLLARLAGVEVGALWMRIPACVGVRRHELGVVQGGG